MVSHSLSMQLMILVDDAGGVLPAINHSPWNGLTLADVVMPFFLFIVGVALGLTYKVPVAASSSAPKIFPVKCGVRGDTGPACNAVGMIDRTVLGIQHLYRKPIYARTNPCSINSPDYGPLPPDAPSWCQAPFDPEGLLSPQAKKT
ncbi:unnamed protein product [Dovyalis caffra]|uniref:Uncharacterized protein n=1 Tax=Dovyalis caffra TaxID=77055 RepID=A0AAV1RJS9_9ROSI|nr:unnamed protein product [Dovyalis caffra]